MNRKKECLNCKDEFVPKRCTQKFCDDVCAKAYQEAKAIQQFANKQRKWRERELYV